MTTFKAANDTPAAAADRVRGAMNIAQIAEAVIEPPFPFRLKAYDGSSAGPDDAAIGVEIVRRALPEPAYLIATNAGYDGREVLAQVTPRGIDEGFDALHGDYGDMFEMGIIDPLRVCRSALQNGASVAGLLLTTEAIIAEPAEDGAGGMPAMPDMGGMGGMM